MKAVIQKIKPEWWILICIAALVLSVFLFFLIREQGFEWYSWLLLPAIATLIFKLYCMMKTAQHELKEFAETIRYRDFSRNFNVQGAPAEVKILREGFNQINSTLRIISREKEMQFLYLQKILELIDVGILSYETKSGKQNWMNQAFKRMFGIPYFKNLDAIRLRNNPLFQAIGEIRPGQVRVFTVQSEKRTFKVLMAASIFQTEEVENKLVAFQNVNLALNENEAEAWQRLLSVMTHEIMNSIAPISSLAGTLKNRISESDKTLKTEDIEDLNLGLATIEKRSEGLLKFAQNFRNLNKPMVAHPQEIQIRDLFEKLIALLQPTLEQKNIELDVVLKDPKLKGKLDAELIEQVLINLIANAADAVKDQKEKCIKLAAEAIDGRLLIRVTDNGAGIPPEILDRIFIPFFTTKKTGNGIGLSLCKQIVLLHKGNIQVISEEGKGTAFELEFE